MCGLKVACLRVWSIKRLVTSFTDVWIESYILNETQLANNVTSFTDVWIERILLRHHMPKRPGHILYGCVDWKKKGVSTVTFVSCHILYGCVDWKNKPDVSTKVDFGHILYGCVDWKLIYGLLPHRRRGCHILYGCVDWKMFTPWQLVEIQKSHPLRMCGLKVIKASFFTHL